MGWSRVAMQRHRQVSEQVTVQHFDMTTGPSENHKKGIINIFDYKSGNKISVDTSCRSVNYLQAIGDGYVIGCNSNRVFVIKNGCMELERSFPTIRLVFAQQIMISQKMAGDSTHKVGLFG